MRNVISQSVLLPASASALFHLYLNAETHAAITGAPASVKAEPGANFEAFGGLLSGAIIAIADASLIVQSWRSADFRPEDPDSTLILSFTQQGESGQINLVHIDVPEHDFDAVAAGWRKHYWEPWEAYLLGDQKKPDTSDA
jgi:activator of HSP90 ATPase